MSVELCDIPISELTYELCLEAVKNDCSQFEHVPDKFKTIEMYTIVLKEDPMLIKDIPKRLHTEEMAWIVLEEMDDDGVGFKYISNNIKTIEMCMKYAKLHATLDGVPDKFLDQNFCSYAINECQVELYHIPDEFLPE